MRWITVQITGQTNRKSCLKLVACCLLLIGWTVGAAAAETTPLRILLTNDDGYDAPGIKVLRKTLVAAGYEVTVVAPLTNQSGSGIRVTIGGTLAVKEQSSGVWSVDGSPADAVLVGLQRVYDELPDIVVSGANFGPNLGYAGSSGTLGAATMATYVGVPAIAISVGVDPAEQGMTPIPFPSTFEAFGGAAELMTRLIRDLQDSRAGQDNLLPARTVLNVNYPPVGTQELRGVRVVPATWDAGVRIDYIDTGVAEQLGVNLRVLAPGESMDNDADWQWFARGFATITVLDGNSDAGDSARVEVSRRLSMQPQKTED